MGLQKGAGKFLKSSGFQKLAFDGGHSTEVAGVVIISNRRGSVSGQTCRQSGSGIGTGHRDNGPNQRGQVRPRVVVFESETKHHAQ